MARQPLLSRFSRLALGLVLTLLLLVGALVWLAGSQPALRWVAQEAQGLSGGQLVVRGVHGSLYGPLRIEALSFTTDETRFELKEARLDWSPLALLRRHVQVDELTLQELQVITLKPGEALPQLPASLRLPASLSIARARVDRIVLKEGGAERVLGDLVLALDKPADTYRLQLSSITSPWGSGQVEATLAEAPPFALSGHASFKQEEGSLPYQAEADVSGTLPRIALKAVASSSGARAEAEAILTPFEQRLLAEARVEARGIDPAKLRKDLPRAEISALITLRSQGREAFTGELSARNALPGTWDMARLPVRALASRFAGTARQMDFGDISLDLAQAGRFVGSGRSEGERIKLTLSTGSFDPRGVHGKMQSMKLAGDIRLEADARAQDLVADLRYQRYQFRLDATHHDDTLEIREAIVRAGGGSLKVFGTVALATDRQFQLAGALKGFDPAAWGDFPRARINASFSGAGRLAPVPEATLRFAIADSDFRGQALAGQGSLSLSEKRLWDSELMLRLARNRLEARGSFGGPGDQLTLRVNADNLAGIDPGLAGRLNASGTLEGSFTAPSGNFDLKADGVRWRQDYRAGRLRASGRLEQGLDGVLTLDASASDVTTPQIKLDQASLAAHGRRAQHTLQFAAKNPDLKLEGSLRGGWHDGSGWSGQLQSLGNQGRFPLALMAPARLEVAPARFLLANARFDVAGATVTVNEVAYKAGQFASRGEVKGLAAAALLRLTAEPSALKTDLLLGGEWRVEARDKVNGRFALWRERGDVTLPTAPETALGLTRLAIDIEALDNRLQARMEGVGSTLGTLKAEAQSLLSRKGEAWGIAGDAPLQATADFSVNSLAWLAPLMDKTGALSLDGALKAQVQGSGTFGQPKLNGTLEGDHFKVELPEQGLHFRDGHFLAELQDEELRLKSLSLRGGEGRLTGQGRLALKEGVPDMQVAVRADKLEVLSRPDRLLILSGTGEVSVKEKRVQVLGKLKADRGLIELPKSDMPSASDDVVILGQEEKTASKGSPYAIRFDLDVDLGERFYLKGRGLDAQLGGAVKLVSADGGLPRSSGSIRIVKGAYAAYGQRLEIERGILNFQGPVDNPGLNIVAMRKNQEVEAGVAISGSAQAPQVRLVSTSPVPDSEKLSWLVLGHGVDASSGPDFSALQVAAGALLAAGDSVTLQQRIAHSAGLEEVSLKGAGTLESSVLTLGKRLSSRAYLSYEHGLSGADTLAKINYTLTQRLSVRAQAGTTPALDLFYTFSFK